jgi:hypothetical protein
MRIGRVGQACPELVEAACPAVVPCAWQATLLTASSAATPAPFTTALITIVIIAFSSFKYC